MARRARRRGKPGGGFGAAPVEPAPVGPGLTGGAFGEGGPARTVGVETVIDGQGQEAPAVGAGPVGGEMQQGEGVAAARQGQGERMIDVRLQPRGQGGQDGPGPVGGIVRQPGLRAAAGAAGATGQPIRVRASVARVLTAALAPSA